MGEEEDLSGIALDWDHKTDRDPEELLAELEELRPSMLRGLELVEQLGYATGMTPRWYFETVARTSPDFSIEFALLRPAADGNGHEVFIRQRPDDDPHWANEWHIPGTTLRPGGDSLLKMWDRILRELDKGKVKIWTSKPTYAFTSATTRADRSRGPGAHEIHYAIVPEGSEFDGGIFFPLHKIGTDEEPEGGLIVHHRRFLKLLKEVID